MSAQNKTIARRIAEEGFSKGDLSVIDQCVAPKHVSHDPHNPPSYQPGPRGMQDIIKLYRGAFPDLKMTVDEQIAEGDRVVTRWTCRGTHKGQLMDLAPTGRSVTVTGLQIDRFENGKVAESWINWDMAGMMQQLGVGGREEKRPDGGKAQPHAR